MKNSEKTYKGYLAVLLWSTAAAFIRSLTEEIGPFTSGFFVYLIGGLLTLFLTSRGEKKLPSLKTLSKPAILSGIIYAVYVFSTTYSIAISKTRVISLAVTVVKSLWPLLTLILSIPMLREKRKLSLFGMLFSFFGVMIVILGGSGGDAIESFTIQLGDITPFLVGFISAISWALYSNVIKKYNVNDSFLGYFMIISGFIMGFLSLFATEPSGWNMEVVLQIIYQAVVTIGVATTLWNQSMIKGDIHKVMIAANYMPLMSIIISSLILRVKIDPSVLIGGAFLVVGNIFHKNMDKKENIEQIPEV